MSRPKPNLTPEQFKARSAMWVKRWRDANPEKQALARKRAYMNRKIKALKAVGDVKCNRCGCDEVDFLEFNHINGNGCKEWRDSRGVAMMDRILTKERGVDGLEILCRVCNSLDFLERKNNESSKKYKIIWNQQSLN